MATDKAPDPARQGTQISALEIASWAKAAGFKGDGLVTATALALEESGGWTQAVNTNADGTKDRGLWQFNTKWHPEVSDAAAFDPKRAAVEAFRVSKGGTDWSQWAAVADHRIDKDLNAAKAAAAAAEASKGGNTTGGETDRDPAYLHPATSLAWALTKAGMTGQPERIAVVSAAIYWNGKRDGLHWEANSNATLWPSISTDQLRAVNATTDQTGRLTGQAEIAARIVGRFGAAALGTTDATTDKLARAAVEGIDKGVHANPAYSPFDLETGDYAANEIDPIGAVGDAIGGLAGLLTSPLAALGALVGVLLDPNTWKRLGLVAGGALVLVGGLYVFTKSTPTGRAVISDARTAAAVAA